ncbi:coproporphyrinogen-III oxidase family protein [Fluviispira sanaruensis]|uniref:Coproporphyrinogen III oxidase n=1 Tax=Fluviispira sanaruensis TaxID=2493639 RepID=A0A4P2VH15_FLUSA|nr:coproporphyrinogen-III oxidase family protein [Fluviispira sanaruensis]BBH52156.1 coproporphyrinogen III oxidase [Fluviispira sanaruensis]
MISLPKQKSRIGIYLHIPFCPHICPYCDFVKTSKFTKKDVNAFFSELSAQLDFFLEKIPHSQNKEYATVYFGGGTPGLFDAFYYEPLLDKIRDRYFIEETTLETNPLTNIKRRFSDYLSVGFDRITLGAQSLCPETLKILGRKHKRDTVLNNIEWARTAGFDNIQVDLIYGLKKEIRTINVADEIQELNDAGASGVSAYALSIEKRTLFANKDFACDENAASEYLLILNKCKSLGFKQLETSNFSKKETFHNNIYWYGLPYLGIGTGAHGLLPPSEEHPFGIRYRIGEEKIKSYAPGNDELIFSQQEHRMKNFSIHSEPLRTKQEYLEEMIFTLLRTPNGISLSWLEKVTENKTISQEILANAKIKRGIEEGKIILENDSIFLFDEEKIRGDLWVSEFISLIK